MDDVNDNNIATSGTFSNITSITPFSNWTLSTSYQVINFVTTYKIRVYDDDLNDLSPNSDDFIGGYSFGLSNAAKNGYPTSLTLQTPGNPLKIDLTLLWQ